MGELPRGPYFQETPFIRLCCPPGRTSSALAPCRVSLEGVLGQFLQDIVDAFYQFGAHLDQAFVRRLVGAVTFPARQRLAPAPEPLSSDQRPAASPASTTRTE